MVLTLYKIDGSPPVRAVRMTIEALGIPDVQYVDVDLFAGEHLTESFLKMNPHHTVPVLKDDDFAIWDSHAIGVYLITKYGKDDSLYPSDPQKRAIVDQRLHFDSGILFPAVRGTLEPVLFGEEKSFRPENLDKIKKAYEFTEKLLNSDWIAGKDFTLADICCGSSATTLNILLPIDRNLYPKLAAWYDRLIQRDVFKKVNAPAVHLFSEFLKSKLT